MHIYDDRVANFPNSDVDSEERYRVRDTSRDAFNRGDGYAFSESSKSLNLETILEESKRGWPTWHRACKQSVLSERRGDGARSSIKDRYKDTRAPFALLSLRFPAIV